MRSKILVAAAVAVAAIGLGAAPAAAGSSDSPSFQCNTTVIGGTVNSVKVQKNGICVLKGVTVNGSVWAGTNAYFESDGSSISGSVFGDEALTLYVWDHSAVGGSVSARHTPQVFVYDSTIGQSIRAKDAVAPGYGHFQVCGSTIGKDVEVAHVGPDVLIGDPATGCGGNTLNHGSIDALHNTADQELYIIGNSVLKGDVEAGNNSGAGDKQVHGNNAPIGTLDCRDNSLPFNGSGNGTVGELAGDQCTTTMVTDHD